MTAAIRNTAAMEASEDIVMDISGETIHVALPDHDATGEYSRHAGVVMQSIFDNTQRSVCVHILHDEPLTDRNRNNFKAVAESHGQQVVFDDVSSLLARMGQSASRLTTLSRYSVGALFPILVPCTLTADRAIYLDSDIVVNLDIGEVWDIDMKGRALAGVRDDFLSSKRRRFLSPEALSARLNGCDLSAYVNSGMLVFDLRRLRDEGRENLLEACSLWFERHRHTARYLDQDFLNAHFKGDITFVDERFNRHGSAGDTENAVIHYTGPVKPWNGMLGRSKELPYWLYFSRTPWAQPLEEVLVRNMMEAAMGSPNMHPHVSRCYKKILSRLRRDLLRWVSRAGTWTAILCAESLCRLKGLFESK